MSSQQQLSILQNKSRSEMTQDELRTLESLEFELGPLSTLKRAVKNRTLVLISCRNNRKLLAKVKAFDRHCNMVLENIKEVRCVPYIILDVGRGRKERKGEEKVEAH